MAAYLIANLKVHDADGFANYRQQVEPMITAFGGRYLVRGGALDHVEGRLEVERLIIVEFPEMAMLRAFYGSPEYTPLIALRQACTTSDVTIVDGYSP